MSESTVQSADVGRKTGITRRSFLKATGAVAGAAALVGGTSSLTAFAEDSAQGQTDAEGEQIFHVACAVNCNTQGCGMKAHVRDGKVCKVSAKTDVKTPEGVKGYEYDRRPCLRGRSHPQWIYDPDRIKYPLRRVDGTERGAGQWERISWDDAIKEISSKFNAYREEFGNQSVAMTRMWGNAGMVHGLYGAVPRFSDAIGATYLNDCLDTGTPVGNQRVVGDLYGGNNSFWDCQNSRNLVIWGANLTDVNVQSWYWATVAQKKGTKIFCIDPRFTTTASKSDKWIRIKQGSDSALILALINQIVSNKLYDEDYLRKHTVAPYLVRDDNGMFLRMSDFGVEPTEGPADSSGKPTVVDPVVVWDESTGAMSSEKESGRSALSGSYNIEGITARTALDLLAERVNDFSLEKTEQLTGVPKDDINELVDAYVNGPCSTWITYGLDRYANDHYIGHAWATLAAISGNYGIQGGGLGLPASAKGGLMLLDPAWMSPGKEYKSSTVPWLCLYDIMQTGKYKDKPYQIKALFNVAGNPFSNHADQKRFLSEVLPKIEFVVTHDSRMTDTCRYSDIVLPATHFFEQDDANGSGAWLQINEKAIEPLYEAKSDLDLFNLLAEPMGVGHLFGKTAVEVLQNSIDNSKALSALGITYDRLKDEKTICHLNPQYYDGIGIRDFKFKSPSGKLEFYQEKPKARMDYGQQIDAESCRLPVYSHPDEAWEDSPLKDKYPLVAFQEHPKWRVHSSFGNLSWLRELDPEPVVKLNPLDAKSRKIESGDTVKCFNDRGYVVVKARIDNALPEGMCNIPKGWQRDQFIEGGYQELTSGKINPISLNQSYGDVRIEIEKVN